MSVPPNLPIVLLPGLDGTGLFLEDLRDELASTRPASIVRYPHDRKLGYAELTAFVSERLPAGKFFVLGESFSGAVAIDIAALHPDRVAGLILAVSFIRPPAPVGDAFAKAWLSARLPRFSWAIGAGLFGGSSTPALRRMLAKAMALVPSAVFAFRIGLIMRIDRRTQLAGLNCPILYLRGRRDLVVRAGSMREVLRAAPHTQVVEVDGPHAMPATHPKDVAAAIEAFFSSRP